MDNIREMPVTIYGNLQKYNDTLSKARCRIFYKYANRNGTYITDEFAEKLLSTVAYAPVKGIYDTDDYTDHGEERDQGRIYGVVPENYNFAWEDHVDEDGVTHTYACVDVLIYTALYKEANEIVGKSQSMELYGPSLQYHEAIVDGKRYIVFDNGCFLGLQVLGNPVEPCFEGASFYALQAKIEDIINQLREYGGTEMPKINFKLSDNEKFDALWTLLNTEFNEEGNWTVTYGISCVYDDYALAINYETAEYERIYYTKNDENNMVEITARKKCYVIDVTEEEKATIDTLRKLNGDTYELVSDTLANAEEIAAQNSEFSAKIEELNTQVATFNSEKENFENQISELNSKDEENVATINALNEKIETLTSENSTLIEYKANVEKEQREAIINEYCGKLPEETLNAYREKSSEYSLEELDMRLTYELKKTNPSMFNKVEEPGFVPKEVPVNGIEAILSKYKNKNN